MTFHRESTTDEVLAGIDLAGRRYLVTGAGSGLGIETVRVLATHGAEVLAAVRDATAPGAALAALRSDLPDAVIAPVSLELGLLDGGPAKVVSASSAGHRIADIDLDDPNWRRRPYDKWDAYGAAKTANILHAVELERRFGDRGLHADAVHPGGIRTNLGRHFDPVDRERMPEIMRITGEASFKSLEAGTATQVWGLAHPEMEGSGGRYLFDCTVSAVYAHPEALGGHAPWALDADRARRLWELSEELVGERFG